MGSAMQPWLAAMPNPTVNPIDTRFSFMMLRSSLFRVFRWKLVEDVCSFCSMLGYCARRGLTYGGNRAFPLIFAVEHRYDAGHTGTLAADSCAAGLCRLHNLHNLL